MEWAPLPRVRASGLIAACAFLLSVPDHRMAAATVLRQLSARKQLQASSKVSRCFQESLQQGPSSACCIMKPFCSMLEAFQSRPEGPCYAFEADDVAV